MMLPKINFAGYPLPDGRGSISTYIGSGKTRYDFANAGGSACATRQNIQLRGSVGQAVPPAGWFFRSLHCMCALHGAATVSERITA